MKKLTINEALAQGYTHFTIDGYEFSLSFEDGYDELQEALNEGIKVDLVEKNPFRFQIKTEDIKDFIIDQTENDDLAEVHFDSIREGIYKLDSHINEFCDKVNPILANMGFTCWGSGIFIEDEAYDNSDDYQGDHYNEIR